MVEDNPAQPTSDVPTPAQATDNPLSVDNVEEDNEQDQPQQEAPLAAGAKEHQEAEDERERLAQEEENR